MRPVDIDDIIHRLRSLGQAYPADIFPPLSDLEIKQNGAIISRAAGSMGRHFSAMFREMADDLERASHSPESNPKRGSPPFPEVEAAGGGSNSPDVINTHSANPQQPTGD